MWQVCSFLTLVASFCIYTVYVAANDIDTRNVEIQEGTNISIDCNISTSYNVPVFWWKNDTNSLFMQPGIRLKFENIKPENAGYYICYSFDTSSFRENNGTAGNKTLNVVNIVVQNADQVNTSNSHSKERMETEMPDGEHVSDGGEEKEEEDEEDNDDAHYYETQMIVVITLGSVGTVSVAIFLVYLMKYRRPRRMMYLLRHFQSKRVTNNQATSE